MSETKAQTIQSEAILKKQFIEQLVAEGYSRAIIPDEDALLMNFRQQFEKQDDNSLTFESFVFQVNSLRISDFLIEDSLKKIFVSYFLKLSSIDDKISHLQQQQTATASSKKLSYSKCLYKYHIKNE
ncbi:hypothetical protein [uncultured Acetobacteroides sp.]|uniref:hypothetical protein n=1 Tax=uncultured Acetobacteroides sp. TaxID=1760811 RepID=UPI0029F49ECC|nr:hypothetical protein [uncultured Acetobacteroides sp.]